MTTSPVHGGYPGEAVIARSEAASGSVVESVKEMLDYLVERNLPLPNGADVDFCEFHVYVYDAGEYLDLATRAEAKPLSETTQVVQGKEAVVSMSAERVFGSGDQTARYIIQCEVSPRA